MIVHVDGDAFFASCEVSKNPALAGRPVVVGEEKGIVTAMTYEAKALGIHRTMPIFQVKKLFPQVIILSSDFDYYHIIAERVYAIMRRYSSCVEEYSIDECFAKVPDSWSIEEVRQVQNVLRTELGVSFSMGLASTKVLAKIASKQQKPNGCVAITPENIDAILAQTLIGKVWGIGVKTAESIRQRGITTAGEFAAKPEQWVKDSFHQPVWEIWKELHGFSVKPVETIDVAAQSVRRTRSFHPFSQDREYLFSELSLNIEHACAALRNQGMHARACSIFLKTTEFQYQNAECHFSLATSLPQDVLLAVRPLFDSLYRKNQRYRTTGITMRMLSPASNQQNDLFDQYKAADKKKDLAGIVDAYGKKYGKDTLSLASSLNSLKKRGRGKRGFSIPFLGTVS